MDTDMDTDTDTDMDTGTNVDMSTDTDIDMVMDTDMDLDIKTTSNLNFSRVTYLCCKKLPFFNRSCMFSFCMKIESKARRTLHRWPTSFSRNRS